MVHLSQASMAKEKTRNKENTARTPEEFVATGRRMFLVLDVLDCLQNSFFNQISVFLGRGIIYDVAEVNDSPK